MVLNFDAGLHAGWDWDKFVPPMSNRCDCVGPKKCQKNLKRFRKVKKKKKETSKKYENRTI